MYFTKIEVQNFGVYKGTHEMCLTNQIGHRNITLIGGLNGRGKTTFLDAILLALYGKLALHYIQENARSYDKLLIDHINKHSLEDETYVAVTLVLDDGTTLRVKRSWQNKGKRLEHNVIVEKNGVADKYLGENWSYYIEEILPFGIARFFFFNNEKITQLADDDSFEQIKSSIKSAIGVCTIEKTIEHLLEVIERKQKKIAAFEESGVSENFKEVDAQIHENNELQAACKQRLNELELKRLDLISTLTATENEFWASGGDLSRNKDSIKQEMQLIRAQVDQAKEEILQLIADASTPLFLCRDLVLQTYNTVHQQEMGNTMRLARQVFPEIHQRITARLEQLQISEELRTQVACILSEELSVPQDDSTPAAGIPISAVGTMLFEQVISDTFQSLQQRITNLLHRVDVGESKWMSLDAHLGATEEQTMALQLFEALKELEREKNDLDHALDKERTTLANLEKHKEALFSKRLQLSLAIAERENANEDDARTIRYAGMSIDVLQEFTNRLQAEKVAKLSDTATACFRQLVEKHSLIQKIHIDPISLDVSIIDIDGKELLKSQLSAGEQQMFAISIVWSLALSSGYKAPVIVDTPMARLDSAHRANFVSKYLPAASSQVLVLSTDEEVYGRYLDLIRKDVVDYYTLLYREDEQCTTIVHGYFEEA